jgi:hypothetical protein
MHCTLLAHCLLVCFEMQAIQEERSVYHFGASNQVPAHLHGLHATICQPEGPPKNQNGE